MRRLVTVIPELTEKQKAEIRAHAEAHGFEARFFDTSGEAAKDSREAEIIFAFAPELTEQAEKLRWYATPSAGVDRFVTPGVLKEDVLLTNGSGAYGVTIAEHVIMLILMILRREKEFEGFVRERRWVRNLPMRGIYGSRITLIGTGDIGSETAVRLRAFAPARMVGINTEGRPNPAMDRVLPIEKIDEVLPETDIVILSLPATGKTFHLLDRRRLKLLPEGALVINVGRGSCIEEEALIEETESGRLYAGIDVFETEPLPSDSPLWNCDQVVMTPHVAGDMSLSHTVEKTVELFLTDFEHYVRGEHLERTVDRKKGY